MQTSSIKPPKNKFKLLIYFLLGAITLILGLILIIPITALLLFDPNQYSTKISSFITEKTGLPIKIHGNIKLKYFPSLGFQIKEIELEHENLFKAKEVAFYINPVELYHSRLTIKALQFKGVELHFVKDDNGRMNWADLSHTKLTKTDNTSTISSSKPATSASAPPENPSVKKLTLTLENIQIDDGRIIYEDRQQKRTLILNKFHLDGKNSTSNIYPLNSDFELTLQTNPNVALVEAHAKISGNLVFEKNWVITGDFMTKWKMKFPHLPKDWQEATLTMNMKGPFDNKLTMKNIDFKAGLTQVTGDCIFPLNLGGPIRFNLQANQLNGDTLHSIETPSAKINSTPALAQSSASLSSTTTKIGAPQKMQSKLPQVKGELYIKQLTMHKLTLTEFKSTFNLTNQTLSLNPLKANLYQGNLEGNVSKDLSQSKSLSFQGKMNNIQIEPLLMDLKQKNTLSGKTQIEYNMTYQFNQGLNGIAKIAVNNGHINGIDINYYLQQAKHLLKKEEIKETNTHQTSFDNFSGSFYIHDNIADCQDLELISSKVKAKGQGTLDFNNQSVSYKIQAFSQSTDNSEPSKQFPLALRINGALEKPKVRPDIDLYLKSTLTPELKNKLSTKVEKFLKESEEDPEKLEKLEKKINKGLKKLFKHANDDAE